MAKRQSKRAGRGAKSRDMESKDFDELKLSKALIDLKLLQEMQERPKDPLPVIIDLNLNAAQGRESAKDWVIQNVDKLGGVVHGAKTEQVDQYVFANMVAQQIRELIEMDSESHGKESAHRTIYRIWLDFPVKALLHQSVRTVKADAARISFAAKGEGILWAVMDSGIERDHVHFRMHRNLDLAPHQPVDHQDFTDHGPAALSDECGHGTHVAGIIAGEYDSTYEPQDEEEPWPRKVHVGLRYLESADAGAAEVSYRREERESICGVAPTCRLVSLKVLDRDGNGLASNLIAAIGYVQNINAHGRSIKIHGINMSVGYSFDPEWFACGQSPLCVEVNRLVRSGVVVVVAAGNSGYGRIDPDAGPRTAGLDLTINDPGNAEMAITVGSTHRDQPHIYGVSYFSSKGPTGDGRLKPDLVAPGEKIVSCAAGTRRAEMESKLPQNGSPAHCDYGEESGTSMAAPHVSGVIAAFLSIRSEFIGQPEKVKEVFLSTATDLKRDPYFQGRGLVDLMRAIQSV